MCHVQLGFDEYTVIFRLVTTSVIPNPQFPFTPIGMGRVGECGKWDWLIFSNSPLHTITILDLTMVRIQYVVQLSGEKLRILQIII